MPRSKWCAVCRRATHDTVDCWGPGTVVVPPPRYLQLVDSHVSMPPGSLSAMVRAIRAAAHLIDSTTYPDPEPFF